MYINGVLLGTIFGIIIGPYCPGLFDPRSWGSRSESDAITLEVMRIVLATGLFVIGVELPKAYMAKHAKGLSAMIVPTMGIGWVIVAGMYYLFMSYLNFTVSRSPPCLVSPVEFYIMLGNICLLDSYGFNYLFLHCWRVVSIYFYFF